MAFTARPSPPLAPSNGLGRGIETGIQALADRIERKREADKLLNANAKAAETLFKNNPSFQKAIGLSADEFSAASAADKNAMMQAAVTHVTLQQAQAKAAREQAEADNAARFPQFAQEVSQMGQDPESLPMVLNDSERSRRTAPINFQSVMGAAARTGYRPDSGLMEDLVRANAQPAKMALPQAFDMARTPPQGFGRGKVTISSTGTPSLQFDPDMSPAQSPVATPILTDDGAQTGKAWIPGENGKPQVIDLSAPNSKGKTLAQDEIKMIQVLITAEQEMDRIEKLFGKFGKDWAGPISGRVKNAISIGQDPEMAAVEASVNATLPTLARGVNREAGVLTDQDIARVKTQLPTAYDTDAVRKVKIEQLRDRIAENLKTLFETLRQSGRDLSGFDKAKAEAKPADTQDAAPADPDAMIPVTTPDGIIGSVPASRLEEALKAGFKKR